MIALVRSSIIVLLGTCAYIQPAAAVVILTALTPVYLLRFDIAGLPTNVFEAGVVLTAAVIASRPAVRLNWRSVWQQLPRLPVVAITGVLIAGIISTSISPHLATSLGILKSWIIVPLLLAWLVYSTIRARPSAVNAITDALTLSGVVVAIVGLLQLTDSGRIQSIYDVPNSLALFITPIVPLAFYRRRYAAAILMAAAVIGTQSAAAISTLIVIAISALLKFAPPASRLRAAAAVLLFTIAAAIYLNTTGRLNYLLNPLTDSQVSNSVTVRVQLWSISRDLLADNAILGIGLGTFEPAYQQALHGRFRQHQDSNSGDQPLPEFVFRDPHNWILSFWLNTGLLGLVSFMGLNLWLIRRRWPAAAGNYLPQAYLLALSAILLHGLTDTIYWKNDLAALYWVIAAVMVAVSHSQNIPSNKEQTTAALDHVPSNNHAQPVRISSSTD